MTENSEVVPAGTETLEVLATGQGAFGTEGTPDVSGYGGLVRTVHAAPAATRPYGGWYDQAVDTSPSNSAATSVLPSPKWSSGTTN